MLAGGRRLDAQPGRDVDHPQHVHRRPRTRGGDRDLGRCGRDQPRAWTGGRRRAHRLDRLAGDLLGQRADRTRRDRPHRAVRPGVARATAPAGGPGRPDPGDRAAGLPDLRDHRGTVRRLVIRAHDRRLHRLADRPRRPAPLRAETARPVDRARLLPQRTVHRRHRDRGCRVCCAGRFPVPQYPLSPGRSRPLGPGCWPLHLAACRGDRCGLADLRPGGRTARFAAVTSGRRHRHCVSAA